jgi:hypothetical protein
MSHLTSKDLKIDPGLILPSGRQQVRKLDYWKLYDVSPQLACLHAYFDNNFADVSAFVALRKPGVTWNWSSSSTEDLKTFMGMIEMIILL